MLDSTRAILPNQHTPGPWADWRRDDGAFHIGTANRVYVARLIGEQNDPETEANARLIISAPALLEENAALRKALEVAVTVRDCLVDCVGVCEDIEAFDAAYNVATKAAVATLAHVVEDQQA